MDPGDTPRQGQYLAFISDSKLHGVPPVEADMQRYFRVSPPAAHEMIKTLERRGSIAPEPGKPRSIRLLMSRRNRRTWNETPPSAGFPEGCPGTNVKAVSDLDWPWGLRRWSSNTSTARGRPF